MKRACAAIVLCAGLMTAACPSSLQVDGGGTRFEAVAIYLESRVPVAAWQFQLHEASGRMRVVGVENGESDAFDGAPYYDLEAVSEGDADRIIVADYSLRPPDELPNGRQRVATVHVQLQGSAEPDYTLRLMAAGGADGESIEASIEFDTL